MKTSASATMWVPTVLVPRRHPVVRSRKPASLSILHIPARSSFPTEPGAKVDIPGKGIIRRTADQADATSHGRPKLHRQPDLVHISKLVLNISRIISCFTICVYVSRPYLVWRLPRCGSFIGFSWFFIHAVYLALISRKRGGIPVLKTSCREGQSL